MTASSAIASRARELQAYLAAGRLVEALREFYAEDAVVQEDLDEPYIGRAANIARAEAWLATVRELRGYEVKALAVDGDRSLVESALDYVDRDGNAVHREQVARAIWRDGRIAEERLYGGRPRRG